MKRKLNKMLKERIREKGYTILRLSEEIGLSHESMRNHLHRNKFTKTSLARACSILGINLNEIEREYDFAYIDETRSFATSSAGRCNENIPFPTIEQAREYSLNLVYRTAIDVLNKTYYEQPIEKRQEIVSALESLLEQYKIGE